MQEKVMDKLQVGHLVDALAKLATEIEEDRCVIVARFSFESWKVELSNLLRSSSVCNFRFFFLSLFFVFGVFCRCRCSYSDACARRFLDGDIDLKTFESEFTPKRHLFHLRSAKKESLLLKQQREKKWNISTIFSMFENWSSMISYIFLQQFFQNAPMFF